MKLASGTYGWRLLQAFYGEASSPTVRNRHCTLGVILFFYVLKRRRSEIQGMDGWIGQGRER
jgi:hypothetical protein